eukprot:594566-Pleurochrysis_carterae.AAC.3
MLIYTSLRSYWAPCAPAAGTPLPFTRGTGVAVGASRLLAAQRGAAMLVCAALRARAPKS